MAFSLRRGRQRPLWSYHPVLEALELRCVPTRFTELGLPNSPWGITYAWDDGHIWFTEPNGGNKVGRVNDNGSITEWVLPTQFADPLGICQASRVEIWFTESHANQVGIIAAGTNFIQEIPVPTPSSYPSGITSDWYSRVFFTETQGNKIGWVRWYGGEYDISEWDIPTESSDL